MPTPLPRPWRLKTSPAERPGAACRSVSTAYTHGCQEARSRLPLHDGLRSSIGVCRAARCNMCGDHVHHRHAGDSRKAKADSVPAPPTPPKQRRMVGPLRPSPRGQLAPGDAVEVRQLAQGSRGSWRLATVKQVHVRGQHKYRHYPRWLCGTQLQSCPMTCRPVITCFHARCTLVSRCCHSRRSCPFAQSECELNISYRGPENVCACSRNWYAAAGAQYERKCFSTVGQVVKGSVAEGCWRYMVEYPGWTVSNDAARPGALASAGPQALAGLGLLREASVPCCGPRALSAVGGPRGAMLCIDCKPVLSPNECPVFGIARVSCRPDASAGGHSRRSLRSHRRCSRRSGRAQAHSDGGHAAGAGRARGGVGCAAQPLNNRRQPQVGSLAVGSLWDTRTSIELVAVADTAGTNGGML